jgi:shikimate kinase
MVEKKSSKNIYLLGFMGAGKTSIGKILAEKLRLEFCDLDELIGRERGKTISRLFAEDGEDFFRDLESKKLLTISRKSGQIISTGGGVVLREANWEVMEKGGITIYLKASTDILWSRIRNDSSRPLLQVDRPVEKVRELLSTRVPFYEKADIIIDTENKSPETVADDIIQRING